MRSFGKPLGARLHNITRLPLVPPKQSNGSSESIARETREKKKKAWQRAQPNSRAECLNSAEQGAQCLLHLLLLLGFAKRPPSAHLLNRIRRPRRAGPLAPPPPPVTLEGRQLPGGLRLV